MKLRIDLQTHSDEILVRLPTVIEKLLKDHPSPPARPTVVPLIHRKQLIGHYVFGPEALIDILPIELLDQIFKLFAEPLLPLDFRARLKTEILLPNDDKLPRNISTPQLAATIHKELVYYQNPNEWPTTL